LIDENNREHVDDRFTTLPTIKAIQQQALMNDAHAPMDFKGFMEGYTQFFGDNQPNLPTRACHRRLSSS